MLCRGSDITTHKLYMLVHVAQTRCVSIFWVAQMPVPALKGSNLLTEDAEDSVFRASDRGTYRTENNMCIYTCNKRS